MRKIVLLAAWLAFPGVSVAALQSVDNDAMAEVTAQSGIAISLELRWNADANGNSLCTAGVLAMKECRLAISLNNRPGEWLVWKNFYGRILVPYLKLDADTVSYTNDGGQTSTIAAVKFGFGGSAVAANKIQINNLTVTNMSIEHDAGPTKGYEVNSEAGFLGLRINGAVAIDGTLKVFPCNANHPRC